MNNILSGRRILITGGTGTFGRACVTDLLERYKPAAIRVYSRDELKQWEMMRQIPEEKRKFVRFFIGDIRDKQRLTRAMEGADYVIHAAALKHVPVCEYNPVEAIKTNVNGTVNVIDAALDTKVSRVISLSTDKACQPINLYGATKLCAEKLMIQANNYRGARETIFSVVRYGNVLGSRGSIVPLFLEQAKSGTITITDTTMTRFWITIKQAVQFVIDSLSTMHGGEIFVPKIPSVKISDLAAVIAPSAKITTIGIRPGEKIHESLINFDESLYAYESVNRYTILSPSLKYTKKMSSFGKKLGNFQYSSNTNAQFLTKNEVTRLLAKMYET